MEMDIDKYVESQNRKDKQTVLGCVWSILAVVVIVLLLILCYSCTTTKYVPVVEHRTDTVQITKQQRDSIWLHDSIYMHEYIQGDTTYIMRDRWHTKYIESIRHDTTYVSKHDTVPQPYPVEVEVERQLTWWQKFRISVANVILGFLVIWGIAFALRTYYKKFL